MTSLRAIVETLGGEMWDGGRRAAVRAPGHSNQDRSIALMISGDRVVIHSFGAADWREISRHLRELGLVDRDGRISGASAAPRGPAAARPDGLLRMRTARALWDGAGPLTPGSPSHAHLVSRVGDLGAEVPADLRHHPAAPVSVFGASARRLPALVARICDPAGALVAVELVYLRHGGRPAADLRLPRKMVGVVPPGAAVRLHGAGRRHLVGEGVMTTLSASRRFQLPGWALLSARNLAQWSPPPLVHSVLIAADRGPAGEAAACALRDRLRSDGVDVEVALPPSGYGDWNDVAVAERRKEEGR